MDKKQLANYYINHHLEGNRENFVYGGEERANYFKTWIGTGKKVLDLGCRDGALTRLFTNGNVVVGVDIDQRALKLCEERLGIKTVWLDINSEELPYRDEEFEVVVAGEILEHVFCPDIFLQKVHKVLKQGGLFLGSVPNSFRLKNRLKFLFGKDYEDDRTHVNHFSFYILQELLEKYFVKNDVSAISSRFLILSPKLFGNTLIWKCNK